MIPDRRSATFRTSSTEGLARGGEMLMDRRTDGVRPHWRLRAFLLSFAVGCAAFLFLLEGSARGGLPPL